MAGAVPQREIVLEALGRLLQWPEIARSPQLGKFLDYIVQRRLAGNEQSIKAYSIAVDVFGRGDDFDPQSDPIVRVQARRLRSLIDDYYLGPGASEPLQIRLPVGRYIPEFVERSESEALPPDPQPEVTPETAAPSEKKRGVPATWYLVAGLASVVVLAVAALTFWAPRQPGNGIAGGTLDQPVISIVEFQNLVTATTMPPQVAGLAIEMVTDLEQFENLSVFYRSGGETLEASGDAPVNEFVLTGIVRQEGEQVQYSAILTESRTGGVVWNQTLTVPAAEAARMGVLDRVSQAFGLVIGSPRGPVHAAARQLMATASPVENINPYLCRVLFDRYRETGAGADAQDAKACLEALPEADKQNAIVLAASASLLAEYVDATEPNAMPLADRVRMAQDRLTRAMAEDPISGFVWEQQARLHESQGLNAQALSDFASSIQLNPANADALADFARLVALSGDLDQAEAMARDAAENSPDPPPWYFAVPTLLALRDGDLAGAVDSAELYAQADRELGPVLAIMAGQQAGNSAVVNRYLPQVLDAPGFRAEGVMPRLRERVSDDALIEQIRRALTEAGVPWNALTRSF